MARRREGVDRARETLAEFFNCHDAEVVFNSGGTEGDNTAIFGLLHPGDHFITTSIEHSANPGSFATKWPTTAWRRRLCRRCPAA